MALLRESGRQSGETHRLGAVIDGNPIASLPHASELLAFADSALGNDKAELAHCRRNLVVIGSPSLVDAAAVIAGFNGITRIADATGIPLEDAKALQTKDLRAELSIDSYQRS